MRRRRSLLSAVGIALAAAMLSAALVVSDGLGRGFDRAAGAADLPDIIARFDPQPAATVAARIRALPDLAAFSLRQEFTGIEFSAGRHDSDSGSVEVVGPGRRGFAIVGGRDLSPRPGEVLLDRGFAASWGIPLGGALYVDGLGTQRVVGFAQSPDNVSYPLAAPRIYVSRAALVQRQVLPPNPTVNIAQIWLRAPRNLAEVLVQARATSYGLHGVRFITRSGVRVLLDQAAGIVIDLLVALSVIALITAALMLAASARAEVQRRLAAIGVRRAVGASRSHLALTQALEAALVAAPAASVGAAAGALSTYGPTGRLLMMLNEPPPGLALAAPLAGVWVAAVAIPVIATAWPAWRAAGRPPVELLGGAELSRRSSRGWRGPARPPTLGSPGGGLGLPGGGLGSPGGGLGSPGGGLGSPGGGLGSPGGGLGSLGMRLVGARRVRLLATATALGGSAAFVLLMLALASALSTLETDPGALGKRYQLVANLPAAAAPHVRSIRGVQAAAPRYETEAVDSFSLDEPIDVIAYPGNHTVFEAPPLTEGRRIAGPPQAEVGSGLATALGLAPGSTLAIELSSGTELRLRVAGVVSSLDHDGRVAYVPAAALLAADPSVPAQLAIRVRPGASVAAVNRALGPAAEPAAGATATGRPLVDTLRSLLRAVAIVDGLVCLYALIQACALTVQERRRTVSVLRAFGAGAPAVRRLLAGAIATIVIPAAVIGVLLERLALGPAMSRLAASYATLPLAAGAPQIAAVLIGLALAAATAVFWVARQTDGEAVVSGLAGA